MTIKPANFRCVLVAMVLTCGVGATAFAQVSSRLDDAQFIQGLRERGMKELLLYYLDKHPPEDPVQLLEIKIEQQRLIFEDPTESNERRAQAALDVVDAYRNLIEKAPITHWKQPIWKIDMVAFVLEQVLPVRYINAAEFVEFGLPTLDQRQAFDKLVAEAAQMMELAGDEHFRLIGDLPRRKDFELDFVNNGRWETIKTDVGELRLPFYRAWSYYMSTLTSKPTKVNDHLAQAKVDLTKVVGGEKLNDAGISRATSLLGRVYIGLKKYDEALRQLDAAAEKAPKDSLDLMKVNLAKTEALNLSKKQADALKLLAEVQTTKPATENWILLVLTYDREFQITKDQTVYPKLFNAPTAARWKPLIEKYVSDRIVERTADQPKDPNKLAEKTPLEVLANVDAMAANANQLKTDAQSETDKEKAKSMVAQSNELFESVVKTLTKFLERKDLDKTMQAQAQFKIGAANYQRGRNYDAAKSFIELAEKYPDQPMAEQCAQYGVLLMEEIHKQFKENQEAIQWYRRALVAQLDKFPNSDFSKKQQYTYAAFLREQKEYEEAIKQYAKVDPSHAFYVDSLYESLACQTEVWKAMPGDKDNKDKRIRVGRATVEFADKAISALDQAVGQAQGKRRESLLYKQGDALLTKVEVMQGIGDVAKAYVELKDYDKQFADYPALISSKRQIAISLLVQMGRVAEARNEIEQYINAHPNQGGAMIKGVLDKVNQQTHEARLRNAPDEAKTLAKVGTDLAEFLLTWAKKQPGFANDPAKMNAFKDILGEQLINAQKYAEAEALYMEMYRTKEGPNSLPVVYGLARSLFHQGPEKYPQAMPLINKILNLAPDKGAPLVWDTWVMRLTMLDQQREDLAKDNKKAESDKMRRTIFTSVAKLRMFDANLGTPQTKSEFQRLELRNQPQ